MMKTTMTKLIFVLKDVKKTGELQMETKKVLSAIIVGVMMITSVSLLSACGENASQDSSQSSQSSNSDGTMQDVTTKEVKQKGFDFSKIEWTTSRERKSGKLQQVIEFTNNSDYPIIDLKITFEQKADTTEEDLKVFDELVKDGEMDKEEVPDIYIVGKYDKYIKQGESRTGSLKINNSHNVTADEQFSIMDPSEGTVKYVDGDKVYAMEYNYLTKKSKVVGEPKQAYKWPEKALGNQIPKLNCEVTSVECDLDELAIIDGYDCSQSKADEYVEECTKLGYVIEDSFGEYTFLKKDKIRIEVKYNEDDKTIYICADIV